MKPSNLESVFYIGWKQVSNVRKTNKMNQITCYFIIEDGTKANYLKLEIQRFPHPFLTKMALWIIVYIIVFDWNEEKTTCTLDVNSTENSFYSLAITGKAQKNYT